MARQEFAISIQSSTEQQMNNSTYPESLLASQLPTCSSTPVEYQEARFCRSVEQLESALSLKSVRSCLLALGASEKGLSEDELQALASDCPLSDWRQIHAELNDFFVVEKERYDFTNPLFRTAVLERYKDELEAERQSIIAYFQSSNGDKNRSVAEISHQLNALDDIQGLAQYLIRSDTLVEMSCRESIRKYWNRLFDAGYKLEDYLAIDVDSLSVRSQIDFYLGVANLESSFFLSELQERCLTKAMNLCEQCMNEGQYTLGESEDQDDNNVLLDYTIASNNLCMAYMKYDRMEEALQIAKKILELNRSRSREEPEQNKRSLAITLSCMGLIHNQLDQFEEAESELLESIEILKDMPEKKNKSFRTQVINNLCADYLHREKYLQAIPYAEQAKQINWDLLQENDKMAFYQESYAQSVNTLGALYDSAGQYTEGEKCFLEALKIFRQIAKQSPRQYLSKVGMVAGNLGSMYWRRHDFQMAKAAAQNSFEAFEQCNKMFPKQFEKELDEAKKNCHVLSVRVETIENEWQLLEELREARLEYQLGHLEASRPMVRLLFKLSGLYFDEERLEEAETLVVEIKEYIEDMILINPDYKSCRGFVQKRLDEIHEKMGLLVEPSEEKQ